MQLVPLPPAIRQALSPASAFVDAQLLVVPASQNAWRPLSLDPPSTAWSLALAAACMLIFWIARDMFERRGGIRTIARGVAGGGLVVSIITFVQRAVSPHLFYGLWRPVARTNTPTPFGPFLSRNDMATWLIMAIPLAGGYAMARIHSRSRGADTATAAMVEDVVDSRMLWLAASLCLMTAVLLASTSRSGVVGGVTGLLILLMLGRGRMSGRQLAWMLGGIVAIAFAATAYVNVPALTARFDSVFAPDLGRGRLTIWRATWPMAHDFWRTGIGIGAFERGMLAYEPRPFDLFINHAHNEYLQLLVEGGVPLAAMATFTTIAGWRETASRLRLDATSIGWIRAGAVAGMAAIAVQSVWDTGLRMPANAVLFAVMAAVALHARNGSGGDHAAGKDARTV
jgi:O-antigen ligase